jgi:hypothetical protein
MSEQSKRNIFSNAVVYVTSILIGHCHIFTSINYVIDNAGKQFTRVETLHLVN